MEEKQTEEQRVSSFIVLRGACEVALRNAYNNEVVSRRINKNTVVTMGRRWVLFKIQSVSPPAEEIEQMAVGTDAAAPTTANVALGNENDRNAIGTYDTTNLTSNPPSWEAQTSWATNEANTTLGEVGLFNSSSGGTLLARATFSTLNKTTSNTLTISYTISN